MTTTATNPYFLTPDLVASKDAMRQKMAMAMLMQGSSGEPVKHWTQGAARIAQALLGAYQLNKMDEADSAREAQVASAIDSLPGMSPSSPPSSPPFVPQNGAPMSVAPMGNKVVQALSAPGPQTANVAGTNDTIPLPPRNPLAGLNPDFRSKFADLRTAAANQGVEFNAGEGVRTPERQEALYAQGRTAPGPIVTGTMNSNHLTGNAMDVAPLNTDAATVGKTVQALIANDPRFAGMRSGAGFKGLYDPLHVEMPQQGTQVASNDAAIPPGAQPAQYNTPQQQPQIRGPEMTPQQQAEIRTLWRNPATRPLAMQKYQEYSKPKEQWLPATPEQRRQAQIPDGVPAQINSVTGEFKVSQPQSVNLQANTAQETAQSKSIGEYYGKMFSDLGGAASKARSSNVTLNTMEQIAKSPNFRSGSGAEFETFLKRGIAAFGGEKALADLGMDPKSAQPNEAFRALSNKAVYDTLGSLGNQISNGDRSFIENVFPGLSRTPEGNALIIKIYKRMNDRAIEIAQMARKHNNGRLDPSFEDKLDQYANEHPLFTDKEMSEITAASGGSGAAPAGPSVDDLIKKYAPR